jgi:hypothetical protein
LGVDVVFPVEDDEAANEFAKAPGFEWVASWQGLSLFARDPEGRGEHVLPASTLYDWYPRSRHGGRPNFVSWPADHELTDLLAAWFGQFGDDEAGRADRAAFEKVAQGCPLGTGLPLPPHPMSTTAQLNVTMQDVHQRPRWQTCGIIVMEAGNVRHLTSFWNLRASGQAPFPWAESHADLLEPFLAGWLAGLGSAPHGERVTPGELLVWLPGDGLVPPRLSALISDGRFRPISQPHDLDLHLCGPLMTNHVRRFTAEVGRTGEAILPLPGLDFLPRRTSWTDLGMVAADIDVGQEANDPFGEAAAVVPAARCVAPHLRSLTDPFTRPRGRGRVLPVRVSEETVPLRPVRAQYLAKKLASDAGYQLAVTENGRRVGHRIRLLGGIAEDSLANQPAVREVIRKALRSPYGANANTLVTTGRRFEGGWAEKSFGRRGFSSYPAQVIGTLGQRGILRPVACLKCPACESTIRLSPSALDEPLTCELCSASVSFAAFIANNPSRPATWAMEAMPALDEAHLNEAIPVMAAVSVFEAVNGKGPFGSGLLYIVGAELTNDHLECEIDFMVLMQDAELPVVIIGEAKAGHPRRPARTDLLSEDDLTHLEAVQNSFRTLGIDCWICFATTRPSLEQSEIELLRRSSDRALTPVFDFQGLCLPVLPIILTGEDLSVAKMDGRHPASRIHGNFPRLPALGKDTCQRQLGLTDLAFTDDSAGNALAMPMWRT